MIQNSWLVLFAAIDREVYPGALLRAEGTIVS
jgi:hypothetical protein